MRKGIWMNSWSFATMIVMIAANATALQLQGQEYDAFPRNLLSHSASNDICKGVDCANGTCVPLSDPPFAKCECNDGWKQPDVPIKIPFLACVIPNCTIDYGCDETGPAPSPSPFNHRYNSLPDPCDYGGVCGGGRCVRNNSDLAYECKCYQGYGNIMNWPVGFCLRQCEIQRDCTRHGISISENSTASASGPTGAINAAGEGSLSLFVYTIVLPMLGTFIIV